MHICEVFCALYHMHATFCHKIEVWNCQLMYICMHCRRFMHNYVTKLMYRTAIWCIFVCIVVDLSGATSHRGISRGPLTVTSCQEVNFTQNHCILLLVCVILYTLHIAIEILLEQHLWNGVVVEVVVKFEIRVDVGKTLAINQISVKTVFRQAIDKN